MFTTKSLFRTLTCDKYHAKVAVGSDVEQAVGIELPVCGWTCFVCVCVFAPLSLPGPLRVAGSNNDISAAYKNKSFFKVQSQQKEEHFN